MDNWTSRAWWKDTAERVITTFLYGIAALLVLDPATITFVIFSSIVLVPTALSFVKAVIAGSRFSSDETVSPASLVKE